MQRHIERLLAATFFIASMLAMAGCSKAQQTEESEEVKSLPLLLSISDRQEWLVVSIANQTPRPITINGLMRLGGKTPELTFFFDGKPAAINKDTHYFTMPPVESEPAVEVDAEKSYGIIIRKEYLPSIFVFPKGSCKEVQIFYKDKISVPGAFVGQIPSNKIKVCL